MAQQQGGGQVENGIVQGADQNAVAQAMSMMFISFVYSSDRNVGFLCSNTV